MSPKANRTELCIFCNSAPCECNKPIKPKAPRKIKNRKVETASVKDELFGTEPEIGSRFKNVEQEHSTTQDELEIAQAIRNLEPLLSSQTKMQYSYILKPKRSSDLDRRILEWKSRHA